MLNDSDICTSKGYRILKLYASPISTKHVRTGIAILNGDFWNDCMILLILIIFLKTDAFIVFLLWLLIKSLRVMLNRAPEWCLFLVWVYKSEVKVWYNKLKRWWLQLWKNWILLNKFLDFFV